MHNNYRGDIMLKIPKGYDTVTKTFRLPEKLTKEMESIASENKISLNKLVVQCLTYAVDNIEKTKD